MIKVVFEDKLGFRLVCLDVSYIFGLGLELVEYAELKVKAQA